MPEIYREPVAVLGNLGNSQEWTDERLRLAHQAVTGAMACFMENSDCVRGSDDKPMLAAVIKNAKKPEGLAVGCEFHARMFCLVNRTHMATRPSVKLALHDENEAREAVARKALVDQARVKQYLIQLHCYQTGSVDPPPDEVITNALQDLGQENFKIMIRTIEENEEEKERRRRRAQKKSRGSR